MIHILFSKYGTYIMLENIENVGEYDSPWFDRWENETPGGFCPSSLLLAAEIPQVHIELLQPRPLDTTWPQKPQIYYKHKRFQALLIEVVVKTANLQ